MKIVCIADTHNKHNQLKDIPDGDMIIHCGDVSGMGRHHEVENFCHWYHKLNFKYKIIFSIFIPRIL